MATELLMRASALYGAASMAAFLLGKVCERQTESALEGARHALEQVTKYLSGSGEDLKAASKLNARLMALEVATYCLVSHCLES